MSKKGKFTKSINLVRRGNLQVKKIKIVKKDS